MSLRNVVVYALLAVAPVFANIDAGAGVDANPVAAGSVGLHADPKDVHAGAGVDALDGTVDAGAGLDISQRSVPRRHRRQLSQDQLGTVGVNQVFTELTGTVGPVLNELTGVVGDLTQPAEQIVSQVTSQLGNLTGLLKGGLGNLNSLTGNLKSVDTSGSVPSNQAVAGTISGVTTSVAQTLQTLNGAVEKIPALGPVVGDATKEIESTLSSVVGVVGQIAAPVLQVLQGLLQPVEGLLSGLGLGSITSVLSGVL